MNGDTTDTSRIWNPGEGQYRDSAGRLKDLDQPDTPAVPDGATEETGTAGNGPEEQLVKPDGENPQTTVDEPKGNPDTQVNFEDTSASGDKTADAQAEEDK